MPQFNAQAVGERRDGLGPVYSAMLAAEERRQQHYEQRYGRIGGMRRPDHVLRAMQRGEPVTVYVSMLPIPREVREQHGWRMGERVRLTPDM